MIATMTIEEEKKLQDDEVEEEDEEEDVENGDEENTPEEAAKKKKKKKGAANGTTAPTALVAKEPSQKPPARGLKDTAFTDYFVKYGQSDPPSIPVAELFKGTCGASNFFM